MTKQTFSNTSSIMIKGFIALLMMAFYGMEYIMVYDISLRLLQLYVFVMFVSLLALGLTIFKKIRLVSYIVFVISFGVFLYLHNTSPEIKEQHGIDARLDSGHGVWDYKEHRCRTDCWHWSWKTGCEKIE